MSKLTLKDLKNLQEDNELDLSARQLTEVPHGLHMVSRLTHVDLSSNKIMTLPNEICKMNKLIKLDLGNNRLHHLPNDFGNLTLLQHLNLFNNEIEELPLSFANLKALKWLDLKRNPLTEKLGKAAGNCGNEKECKAAAHSVVKYVEEQKKFVEYQKEKEDKVLAKIHQKNLEEKAKSQGNAKSNGAAAHKETSSKSVPSQQPKAATEKKKTQNTKKIVVEAKQAKRGIFSRFFGLLYSIFYYASLATFAASTVAILINCNDGAKQIPGSKPLCADLTKLSQFTKPSPQFFTNLKNTYGTVLKGYDKQLQPYYKPATKKVSDSWKQFAKTPTGNQVEKYVYQAHTFVVEKFVLVQRFVQKKWNEVVVWYNKEGHKHVGGIVESIKVGSLMVFEIVKDVLTHVLNSLVHVGRRAQKFAVALVEGGFQAALKTLN